MKFSKNIKIIFDALKMVWLLDRAVIVTTVFISTINAIIPYIGILLSAYVVDGLTAGKNMSTLILTTCGVVGGIFILTVLNSYLSQILSLHTSICVRKFDMKMCERTLTMDYGMVDSPQINDIRARIRTDNNWGAGFNSVIWELPWVLSSIISLVTSVIILIPLFVGTSLLSDFGAIALLIAFFVVIIFNTIFNKIKTEKKYQIVNDPCCMRNYFFYFLFGGKGTDYKLGRDIRIYDAKNTILQYMNDDDKIYKKEFVGALTRNDSSVGFVNGMSTGFLQGGAYLLVVLRAISGSLTAGSVLKYASTIYRFAIALSDVFKSFTEYTIAASRQQSTLEYMKVPDVLPKGSLTVEKRADNEYEIEFCDVTFKYPGSEQYALKHLNLRLNIGHKMAVVGMNGSGKTTMIKLLCRLYDPTEGKITLNGIDIKKYDYDEYMGIFGVVFQDFQLFSFSLGQNVATSVKIDDKKAIDCLEKAGFLDRLVAMPKGIDTPIYKNFDDDGVEISGGEAQKIALARVLYKSAPFIILDEPTAALDPIAEFDIYSRFNEIVGDKTAIFISHRLSSCRFCNDIAVFHEGELVQRGSHNDLVAKENGKYCELWNAQAQYYTDEAESA